jgi:creatinine amidohydrolase/Fe(II)-dependent formamide hydrolase-like protein
MSRALSFTGVAVFVLACAGPVAAQGSVYVEELTWTEVRDAIKAGKTTVILPTGGTEQNGPHMVLGKENLAVHYTAGAIAQKLGNALVAPTLQYVPEGNVDPPSGAMRYPGGITLPNDVFVQVLLWAGRSFKVNGFRDIVLIGNSGGNQAGLKTAAEQLNKEWAGSGVRAHFVDAYYNATTSGGPFEQWLLAQGVKKEEIGTHAGIRDTSTLMATEADHFTKGKLIRWDKLARGGGFEGSGVSGNPTLASVEYGRKGLEFKVNEAVNQIRALTARR